MDPQSWKWLKVMVEAFVKADDRQRNRMAWQCLFDMEEVGRLPPKVKTGLEMQSMHARKLMAICLLVSVLVVCDQQFVYSGSLRTDGHACCLSFCRPKSKDEAPVKQRTGGHQRKEVEYAKPIFGASMSKAMLPDKEAFLRVDPGEHFAIGSEHVAAKAALRSGPGPPGRATVGASAAKQ